MGGWHVSRLSTAFPVACCSALLLSALVACNAAWSVSGLHLLFSVGPQQPADRWPHCGRSVSWLYLKLVLGVSRKQHMHACLCNGLPCLPHNTSED